MYKTGCTGVMLALGMFAHTAQAVPEGAYGGVNIAIGRYSAKTTNEKLREQSAQFGGFLGAQTRAGACAVLGLELQGSYDTIDDTFGKDHYRTHGRGQLVPRFGWIVDDKFVAFCQVGLGQQRVVLTTDTGTHRRCATYYSPAIGVDAWINDRFLMRSELVYDIVDADVFKDRPKKIGVRASLGWRF